MPRPLLSSPPAPPPVNRIGNRARAIWTKIQQIESDHIMSQTVVEASHPRFSGGVWGAGVGITPRPLPTLAEPRWNSRHTKRAERAEQRSPPAIILFTPVEPPPPPPTTRSAQTQFVATWQPGSVSRVPYFPTFPRSRLRAFVWIAAAGTGTGTESKSRCILGRLVTKGDGW